MHELALTMEIVDLVRAQAGDARVSRVVLEIGSLAAVLPDAVRFCFDLCIQDSPLAGASLDILRPPGRARCRACGAEVALSRPAGSCGCGSSDLDWIDGEQIVLRSVEVL